MPESQKHLYIQAALIVLLPAGLAGISSVYNKLVETEKQAEARMDSIEDTMISRHVLDQRFSHLNYRLNQVEEKCCSEVGEPTGGL